MEEDIMRCGNDLQWLIWWINHHRGNSDLADVISKRG